MDSSLSLSSSTLSVNKQIESNYSLAVKLFMNKNFEKSFKLIKELYDQSFSEYGKGLISHKLFVKIINLYLIEVGLALSSDTTLRLTQIETHRIVTSLLNNDITNNLLKIYNSESNIPLEIIFNYNLLLITNRELLVVDDSAFLNKIRRVYASIDLKNNEDDKYLKKLIDLYTFEILPTFDEFDEARHVVQSNQVYADSIQENLKRIDAIEKQKLDILETEKQKKLEKQRLEYEQKQRDIQKKKDLEASQNLSYKSIKEIQRQYNSESPAPQATITSNSQATQLEQLKSKLFYMYRILKNYLKDNSSVILVALVVILASSKFINFKKLNLKDRFVETVRMAFKVSYL
ncbi:uncharacterized protein RJT20DRAFT_126684 [Scheffersomyces xylosifermentans]|uniref:uncharacterized protein n=1 Tax=Scheffersomyces xylosifermentans TaxID=1304137 RepID=UPI00315DADD6